MKTFETKSVDNSVLDVSTNDRRVRTVLNRTDEKDLDRDVVDSKAFDKTIKERGPGAKDLIWHLTDHFPSLKYAVGKFTSLEMEGKNLVGTTVIPKTTWGNDVLELYKSGAINQHSIGFSTVKREIINEDDPSIRYNVIKELTLYEGSSVLWAANEHTPTLTVGKNLTLEQRQTEFEKTMEELGSFHKMFKLGHLTDSTYELIEVKISQLSQKLQQLFAALPDQKSVESQSTGPDDQSVHADRKKLLEVLTTFSNNLNDNNGKDTGRTSSRAA
jgi:HK97 family phage prohead protease